jgi:hypothetical protein
MVHFCEVLHLATIPTKDFHVVAFLRKFQAPEHTLRIAARELKSLVSNDGRASVDTNCQVPQVPRAAGT